MMGKKRSVGVTAFGILFIIIAISGWLRLAVDEFGSIDTLYSRIITIFLFIFGYGILRLREWARKGIICYGIIVAPVQLFLYSQGVNLNIAKSLSVSQVRVPVLIIGYLFIVVYTVSIIYFFTRPKVREQFK